jgi:protein-L-isoaspartate(D-aspartate) O-methyltransferase
VRRAAVYEVERERMVERLKAIGYIRNPRLARAMKEVPRHLFVPEEEREFAYHDIPLPIGEGQTISAPHMVAIMCEALNLQEGHRVLEIGTGCGYHACVVSRIVGEGEVYSIERIESLGRKARETLRGAGCSRVVVILGDGTKGYPEAAPYDRVYITAGTPQIPDPLREQLKVGGKILLPLGSRYGQDLVLGVKTPAGDLETKSLGGCIFVPLIPEEEE